jgi:hypothetical protein
VSVLLAKFNHKHHNRKMRQVSVPIDEIAELLFERVPAGTLRNDGLRALLKAREYFMRALVAAEAGGARKPGSIGRARDRRRAAGDMAPHL